MKKSLTNTDGPERSSVQLPAGSLWSDLRAERGSGGGLEWLLLYEHDSCAVLHPDRIIYLKILILTPDGRRNAESGQVAILMRCNLHKFETALFSKALALAMSQWDSEH